MMRFIIWTALNHKIFWIMKNLFVLFLVGLSYFYGYNQSSNSDQFKYKVAYELIYQPDSTDTELKKREMMYLYIGNKISRFSSAGKAMVDDLNQSQKDHANYIRMRRQIPKSDFNYYVYKGIPSGKITYTTEIINDKYRYIENRNLFNWKIEQETDTISGFPVQKATTSYAGRFYTAWFTEKIPYPDGPYKFNGLPGLILQIEDAKEHYVFKMKEIQKLEDPIPLAFQEDEFIQTTSKELSDLQEEFKRDPAGFAARALPGFNADYLTKSQKNRAKKQRLERLKKDNNPLELK